MNGTPVKKKDPRCGLWITLAVAFALLGGFALFLSKPRARRTSAHNYCVNNLRQIDGAKDQWAIEHHAHDGDLVVLEEVAGYIKGNVIPKCPEGGKYQLGRLGENPTCSIGGPYHSLPTN